MALLIKYEKTKNGVNLVAMRMRGLPGVLWKTSWKVGHEDPRRVVHAIKVGATLCKGLNRGLGTILAGSLALLVECIAAPGDIFRAVFIGATVFLIGAASTYIRFFPYIKKNYDYGVVIFLLTFNLITVSSYRVENVWKIAQERFYTIAIGCGICLLMSLLIFPNWSGEDLHNSTVLKLEGLAKSIEACINEYFNEMETNGDQQKSSEDFIYKGYKAVLDSKSSDETLALHASWEPRHSRHCYTYPWQQYVKLGAVLRHFGYTVVALHGCLQTEIQAPLSVRVLFKDPCTRVASEVTKVLMELANSIRHHRHCSPELLSDHLHEALKDLNNAIKSQPRLFLGSNQTQATNMIALAAAAAGQKHSVSLSTVKTDTSALLEWKSKRSNEKSKEAERKFLRPSLSKLAITSLEFSEALPFAAFASLLLEIVARLDLVIEEVEELGRSANFKEFKPGDEIVERVQQKECALNLENHLPSHGVE
ncbi:Aluminum-activated malate transporter [Dillenia turbinata]|uniref:Aluminum-activated malate transporter n=1 Tax=Dillenia turbinata TaxID=194707 RepID=A0AAN8VH64_9MAGN